MRTTFGETSSTRLEMARGVPVVGHEQQRPSNGLQRADGISLVSRFEGGGRLVEDQEVGGSNIIRASTTRAFSAADSHAAARRRRPPRSQRRRAPCAVRRSRRAGSGAVSTSSTVWSPSMRCHRVRGEVAERNDRADGDTPPWAWSRPRPASVRCSAAPLTPTRTTLAPADEQNQVAGDAACAQRLSTC